MSDGLIVFGDPRQLIDAMEELETLNIGKVVKYGGILGPPAGHLGYIILKSPGRLPKELFRWIVNHCLYRMYIDFPWGEDEDAFPSAPKEKKHETNH